MASGQPVLSSNSSIFNQTIDFIIGAPPVSSRDSDSSAGTIRPGPSRQSVIHNAMPIVHIQPGIPNFTRGLDLMGRSPAFSSGSDEYTAGDLGRTGKRNSYVQQLRNLGFSLKQPSPSISGFLTCAFLADSFPTDTFTNEYGENFLQKITNVASEGMASLTQMLGGRSITQTAENIIASAKQAGGWAKSGADLAASGMQQIKNMASNLPSNAMLGRIANNVDVLAAGGRIDFPMLWKNSTYSPSYTMTIRLYNPDPGSKEATAKFIIGPIAALLLLGLPQSVGEGAYSWPFIHRFYAPGIYNLDPGYIANITVVKGGDQQQISWKQTMGVVDVRIDFGSVFNSILSNASSSRNRPTLKGYLEAMSSQKEGVVGLTDFNQVNNETNQSPATIERSKNIGSNTQGLTNAEVRNYSSNRAGQRADVSPTQEKTQLDITEPGETISARTPQSIKTIADHLIELIPVGVKIEF
jgi:hypothetical protein